VFRANVSGMKPSGTCEAKPTWKQRRIDSDEKIFPSRNGNSADRYPIESFLENQAQAKAFIRSKIKANVPSDMALCREVLPTSLIRADNIDKAPGNDCQDTHLVSKLEGAQPLRTLFLHSNGSASRERRWSFSWNNRPKVMLREGNKR
jgi:hypothetical protein